MPLQMSPGFFYRTFRELNLYYKTIDVEEFEYYFSQITATFKTWPNDLQFAFYEYVLTGSYRAINQLELTSPHLIIELQNLVANWDNIFYVNNRASYAFRFMDLRVNLERTMVDKVTQLDSNQFMELYRLLNLANRWFPPNAAMKSRATTLFRKKQERQSPVLNERMPPVLNMATLKMEDHTSDPPSNEHNCRRLR